MNGNLFYRHFELDRATVNKEARTVDLSFSSETPVMRWFGQEILLHGEKNVDLSRLRSMGSALFNHNPDRIVGRVKDPKIENGKGRAAIVFDEDQEGEQAMQKVVSGSLRGVSVGYAINKFREVREGEEWEGVKGPAYVATRWTPYEISLTPIPADATVGVGRDATRSLDGIEIEHGNTKNFTEERTMNEEQIKALVESMLAARKVPSAEEIAAQVRDMLEQNAKPQFRITPDELIDLTGRAGAISPEAKAKVVDLYMEGKNATEVRNAILDMAAKKPDANDPGKGPEGNHQQDPAGYQPAYRKVEDVPDDVFDQMITNPDTMPIH